MTHRTVLRKPSPASRATGAILLAVAGFTGTCPAMAAVDFSAGAALGVEHNTNVFDLSGFEAPPASDSGDIHRGDTATRITAQAGTTITAGRSLSAQLTGLFTRVESARFESLSRNEHNVGGGLSWTPANQVFDASLQLSQQRIPVEFADIGGDEVKQQKAFQAQLSFRVRPTPRWQISVSPPGLNNFSLPLDSAPEFEFRQVAGSIGLDYLGGGRLVPGIVVGYARGKYSGIQNATRYRQQSYQGTLNYRATGRSTLSVAAGYTQRDTRLIEPSNDPVALANEGKDSAVTGALNLQHQFSVKTGINVGAFRYFQQYYAGVNTSVGTGFTTGINWAATTKLTAALDIQHAWAKISGIPVAGTVTRREDLVRSYSLSVSYAATKRVGMRTYFTRRIRSSTVGADQFNGFTTGLELSAAFF